MSNDLVVVKDWKGAEEHVKKAFSVHLKEFGWDIKKQTEYKLAATRLLLRYGTGDNSTRMYDAMMAFPV